MRRAASAHPRVTLEATVLRADGRVERLGVVADSADGTITRRPGFKKTWFARIRRF